MHSNLALTLLPEHVQKVKKLTHLFKRLVIDAALLILLLLPDEIGVVEVEVGRGRDLLHVAEQEVENSSGIFGLFFDWNGINCCKRLT